MVSVVSLFYPSRITDNHPMLRRFALFLLALHLLFPRFAAAGDRQDALHAVRVKTPPVIDGVLSELVWKSAPPAGPLTQRDPQEGMPASEESDIRVVYDDEALYFGFLLRDSHPQNIVARLTRRDDEIESDFASIRIDSYHDHQTCFEFTFNAAGVKTDIIQFDDGEREDAAWDPVWDVETEITPEGWTAEVRIPFAVLRYPTLDPGEEQEWGINLIRYISAKQENERWAFTPKSESGFISRFGHIRGLRDLPPPHSLELLPFVLARQEWPSRDAEPGSTSPNASGSGGVDLRVGLSNNFMLDATVNPDFGQVEADPALLNLTTFETFYPEKRPFFVEGTQILHFGTFGDEAGPGAFYSRRIGRAIDADEIALPSGSRLLESPVRAAILGAAKLTGRTEGGLSLGILEAVTRRESAVVEDSLGRQSLPVVEPLAHYNIVRVRQDVLSNSYVGGILTTVLREGGAPSLTAGADWNLRLGGGDYQMTGFLAGTSTTSPSAIAPDRPRITGMAGKLEASLIGALHWLWSLSGDFTTPHYNINDAGFFRRPNDFGGVAMLRYKEDVPSSWARNYSATLSAHERWTFDGVNIVRQAALSGSWLLPNYWSLDAKASADAGMYDDRESRGNGLYRKPKSFQAGVGFESDERGDLVAEVQQAFAGDSRGKHVSSTGVEFRLRPASWMNWEVECQFDRTWNQESWVANIESPGGVASIFADRATDALDLMLRGTITFTRELTLQLYGQLFLARGRYEGFRQLEGSDRFTPVAYAESHDFNERAFNANLVLRWEYLPGSTLYFVWSQAREGSSDEYSSPFTTSLRETFALPASNVIMVKASYWQSL